jgi:hypothetical protein
MKPGREGKTAIATFVAKGNGRETVSAAGKI